MYKRGLKPRYVLTLNLTNWLKKNSGFLCVITRTPSESQNNTTENRLKYFWMVTKCAERSERDQSIYNKLKDLSTQLCI